MVSAAKPSLMVGGLSYCHRRVTPSRTSLQSNRTHNQYCLCAKTFPYEAEESYTYRTFAGDPIYQCISQENRIYICPKSELCTRCMVIKLHKDKKTNNNTCITTYTCMSQQEHVCDISLHYKWHHKHPYYLQKWENQIYRRDIIFDISTSSYK